MKIFEWNDKFDVGIDVLNKQHQKLIDMVNDLYDAMRSGKSKELIDKILNELVEYSIHHFDTEEQLFSKYRYPDAKAHIAEHQAFKAKVADLMTAYEKGTTTVSMNTLHFLKDWVTKHILDTDGAYVAHLTKHM